MAIPKHVQKNFNTISDAFKDERIALLECKKKENQEPVFLLCSVNQCDDGEFDFLPLARVFSFDDSDNPYELFEPPM